MGQEKRVMPGRKQEKKGKSKRGEKQKNPHSSKRILRKVGQKIEIRRKQKNQRKTRGQLKINGHKQK